MNWRLLLGDFLMFFVTFSWSKHL